MVSFWPWRGDYYPRHGYRFTGILSFYTYILVDTRNKAHGGKGRSPIRVCWVFTAKAECQDKDQIDSLMQEADELCGQLVDQCEKYAFQLEAAPTTGYLHFQGYFELVNKKSFDWIQKHIRQFEYLKERKGSPHQAWAYATKQETRILGPWLLGEPTVAEHGKNKASELFVLDVKKGMTDLQLSESHPAMFLQRIRGLDRLRENMKPQRTSPIEVFLFYGPPGVGKTEFAYEQARLAGVEPYEIPLGKDFWTSAAIYGAKWVILDEFKSNLSLKDLLKLLDNRPVEVPMKGSFNWWCPEVVIITTNVSPWNWYQYKERDFERQALFRRLKTGGCYKFEKNDAKVPIPVEIDIEDQSVFGPQEEQILIRSTKAKSAMESYFEMKMKHLQAQPMMGLVRQPVMPMKASVVAKQKVQEVQKTPPYRYDPVTKKVVPATGVVEQQTIVFPREEEQRGCPPVYKLYKGLARADTMTQQMLMDGYSKDEAMSIDQ